MSVPLHEQRENRHLTHRRMERWIRLQQFVYGLPSDYSYAVCVRQAQTEDEKDGRHESRALVKVGWMSWYGFGRGADPQHSLAVALLETSEALSANGTSVFLHRVKRWIVAGLGMLRLKAAKETKAGPREEEQTDLLAS